MQESSCDPHKIGGAGEQGMMQITKVNPSGIISASCPNSSTMPSRTSVLERPITTAQFRWVVLVTLLDFLLNIGLLVVQHHEGS